MGSSSSSKHLKDLLTQDQEPFILQDYIKEKRHHHHHHHQSTLQLKNRKPISQSTSSSSFPLTFCKNACFFSTPKSPVLFSPVSKSSSPNNHTLFVKIPARTSALLLEAALRIQSNSSPQKSRKGFGLFGSIFKKLSLKMKKGVEQEEEQEDVIKWDSSCLNKQVVGVGFQEKGVCESSSRRTSVWSESHVDLDTSSSRSEDSEEEMDDDESSDFKGFCSSPFQFVLQEFNTPLSSPSRHKHQVLENEEGSMGGVGKEQDDDDKEQNSPVSVLDPPFEDDDDEGQEDEMESEQNGFELECSFATGQRAKQQLLHKLRRFERLAELDPIELEKRIAEQEDEDRDNYGNCNDDDEASVISDNGDGDYICVRQVLQQSDSSYYHYPTISSDTKRLIMDLVAEEEERRTVPYNRDLIAEEVSKRLESWKEVDSDTIDMMVELDFKRATDEWRNNTEQMQETAVAVECAIFTFLVEEFSNELCSF